MNWFRKTTPRGKIEVAERPSHANPDKEIVELVVGVAECLEETTKAVVNIDSKLDKVIELLERNDRATQENQSDKEPSNGASPEASFFASHEELL